jgi:ABC-type phosphate transport system auxiliary subunit
MALPGRYVVKLTVNGKSQEQPLTLRMDPRIKTPAAELRAQFEMEIGAVRGMNESFKLLEQVRSVHEQLTERSTNAGDSPLVASVSAVEKKIAELEGSAESGFFGVPNSAKRPENFSTLNQHFGNLLAVADSADSAPTSQAQNAYREKLEALQNLETQWTLIRKQDIPQLNSEIVKAGKTPIDPDKPASARASSDGDGDDEP